jgi:hypothetical protein
MAGLEFFVLAESVSIDQATNRLSVFNILEELRGRTLPRQAPQIVVVSVLLFEEEEQRREWQLALIIRDPAGVERNRFNTNIQGQSRRHRIIQQLRGYSFDSVGEWRAEIELNGEHKACHRLTVAPPDPDLPG